MRIDAALLRHLLRYEPETGKLFWARRDVMLFEATAAKSAETQCLWWNGRFADKEAFTASGAHSARHGKIFGQPYYAHIVIWALQTGAWPENDIDHEDGVRSNNVWANLRDVTHQVNMQNKQVYKSSKSGVHGVAWRESRRRWQAYITVNKRRSHLGYFNNKDSAVAARMTAEREAGCFHANHGRA